MGNNKHTAKITALIHGAGMGGSAHASNPGQADHRRVPGRVKVQPAPHTQFMARSREEREANYANEEDASIPLDIFNKF